MRKRIISLLTAAAIVVSFTGCTPQGSAGNSSENKETQASQAKTEEESQTIKIGAVYPLTGTSAETGNQTINTLKAMASLSIMNMILIIPLPRPRDFLIWAMQR